jgi:hypothetical protein
MKKYIPILSGIFIVILSGCRYRLVKTDEAFVYYSIKMSKENDAFVNELRPESPFIKLAGQKIYINEAWLEHPHQQGNFHDVIMKDVAMVIRFHWTPGDSVTLRKYIEQSGIGGSASDGTSRVSMYLSQEEYSKDTLILHYRETLDSAKKNKVFLLFKTR